MKIEDVPFTVTDWSTLLPVDAPGEAGSAAARGVEQGNLRQRMVEFRAGYRADHWCRRGHVVLVQAGSLSIELDDGRRFEIGAGQSFAVADEDGAHMVSTATGATVFIVD